MYRIKLQTRNVQISSHMIYILYILHINDVLYYIIYTYIAVVILYIEYLNLKYQNIQFWCSVTIRVLYIKYIIENNDHRETWLCLFFS